MRQVLIALFTPWTRAWRETAQRPALLLAYLGFGWAGWHFVGPFGAAGLGLLNLRQIASGPCCSESLSISPSEAVAFLLLDHLPGTLLLLGLSVLLTGGLAWLLIRAEALGLPGWLLRLIHAGLQAPLAPLALLAALALIRLGQAESFAAPVLKPLPLGIGALLLALPGGLSLAAGWREGPDSAARAFYLQAETLFAGWLAVESVLNIKGLGGLLLRALRAEDLPVVFGLLWLFPLIWWWVRLGQMAPTPAPSVEETRARPGNLRGFAPLIGLTALGGLLLLWRFPLANPLQAGALPETLPPLGADGLGRDLIGAAGLNLVELTFGALLAALLSGLIGWAWARLMQIEAAGGWPAWILRVLAEWLTLVHPVIVGLLLMRSAGSQTLAALALGLMLAPRVALTEAGPALDAGWIEWLAALPRRAVSALTLLVTLGMLWPEPAGLLPDPQALIAGVLAIRGAGYYGLALIGSLPPLAVAVALALARPLDEA